MFQTILNEWLEDTIRSERMYNNLESEIEFCKKFASFLDTRGLTLHAAESGALRYCGHDIPNPQTKDTCDICGLPFPRKA